ncbi:MAG: hypothetical protein NTV49_11805 [Kiritimatiellaeota bacterium]|nr:hypothetical protein [Kiritimatiellota bacterium]
MKAFVWLLTGWLTFLGAAFGADQPQPADNLTLDKPVVNKPPPSINSVAIKGQLVTAKDSKNPNAKPKQLIITVNRMCKDDLGDCVAKWNVIGLDVTERKLESIGSGELPVTLTNRLPQCVTSSPPVTISYTPANRGQPGKVIHASGYKLSGWSVQVYQGSALVGEKYEPVSLKAEMAKQAKGDK